MDKNNQPLILGIVVIGAVLIIALALIFTRSDSETEAPTENVVSENEENEAGEEEEAEEDENDGQQPDPQPTPPVPTPDPQPGVLPPNWDELTTPAKTDLNPFGCDIETQYVRADNGQCIDRSDTPDSPIPGVFIDRVYLPAEPTKEDFMALLDPHLTEQAKTVMREHTELRDGKAFVEDGLCRESRTFGGICGGYYSPSSHTAYTFYDPDNRNPKREFATFIHELAHALDGHDNFLGVDQPHSLQTWYKTNHAGS